MFDSYSLQTLPFHLSPMRMCLSVRDAEPPSAGESGLASALATVADFSFSIGLIYDSDFCPPDSLPRTLDDFAPFNVNEIFMVMIKRI